MIAGFQLTLPHFYKILAGQLLHQPQHFQLKQRGNQLGRRGIFHFLKEIVQMYGGIHLQRLERFPGRTIQLRSGAFSY